MKKRTPITTVLFFSLVLLVTTVACNMGTKEERTKNDNTSESTTNTTEDSEVYMSADSWRSWAPPKQLSDYSLKNFVTDPFKLQGLHSASARYENGEQFINVQIIDGSSDKGKREIRDHLEIADLERDHSSDYGYEKTLERNGIKAKEEYLAPPAGQYLIKFMLHEKYGVSIKSNAETAEEIWDFIDTLNLDAISN